MEIKLNPMKKTLLLLSLALAAFTYADAAKMEVGYCNGLSSDNTASKVGNCKVSAGIILSEEMLSPYIGAKITGVRLYLSTVENVSELSAWVRQDLESEDIISGVAETVTEGWQTIPVDGSYLIDGSPLALGYSFQQPKSVKCITLAGDYSDDGRYIAKNDAWEKYSGLKAYGSLCIELEIEGENVPAVDLELKKVTFESPIVKNGENLSGTFNVRNSSLTPVEQFEYTVAGGDYYTFTGSYESTLDPKQNVAIEFEIPTQSLPSDIPLEASVAVKCENDGVNHNNSLNTKVASYTESYPRTLLMEEFTTEECPNCPRAINTIKQAMENGYADKMIVVSHHVGFYTDWLTLEEDSQLLWLYGGDGTFAPAGMYDRTPLTSSTTSPVESIAYFDTFGPRLDTALAYPAFVAVEVSPQISDDEVIVKVNAQALPVLNVLCENPRITVLLIEDGIVHHNQAGITNPDFTHSHVTRAYLTPVEGELFSWTDGFMTWEGTMKIASDWVTDNMEAVAFISNYNANDATDCRVYNTAAASLDLSSVKGLHEDVSDMEVEYYDLSGRKVLNPSSGIFIKKTLQESGKAIFSKIIIK